MVGPVEALKHLLRQNSPPKSARQELGSFGCLFGALIDVNCCALLFGFHGHWKIVMNYDSSDCVEGLRWRRNFDFSLMHLIDNMNGRECGV